MIKNDLYFVFLYFLSFSNVVEVMAGKKDLEEDYLAALDALVASVDIVYFHKHQ
jgi:hypothetical protein